MDVDLRSLERRAAGDLDEEAVREVIVAVSRLGSRAPHCRCRCHDSVGSWCPAPDDVPAKDRRFLTAGRLRAAGVECIPANVPFIMDWISWPGITCERQLKNERFGSVAEAAAALAARPWPMFVFEPSDERAFRDFVVAFDLSEQARLAVAVRGLGPFVVKHASGPAPQMDEDRYLELLDFERVILADALVARRDAGEPIRQGAYFEPCGECAAPHFAAASGALAARNGQDEVGLSMGLLSEDIETRVQAKAALHRRGVRVL